MKTRCTTKKVKVKGKEEYLNPQTGEVKEFDVISVEERDFNFHKVWMTPFAEAVKDLGNQKTNVFFWILLNCNRQNQLVFSQRQIAKQTGTSIQTVNLTIKSMIESNLLSMYGKVYVLNPNVVFKGSKIARENVGYTYNKARVHAQKRKKTQMAEG